MAHGVPIRAVNRLRLVQLDTRLLVLWLVLFAVRALWHTRLRRRRRLGLTQTTLHSLARWSLDAVSALFLAVVVVFVQAAPTPGLGCGWATLELAFFLWYSRRLHRLDAVGTASDDWSSSVVSQGLGVFQRLLDEREGALEMLQRYPHHIQDWFVGSATPVGVGNVADLLDHLLLQGQAKKMASMKEGAEHEGLLHSWASSLWKQLGLEKEADQTEDQAEAAIAAQSYVAGATPISPADQPLMACYRPLLFYVLMEAIAGWAHMSLTLRLGFKRAAITPTAAYYVKQGRKPHRPPFVFLHGIGIGLAPYLPFLSRLAARTGRTVVAVQYKHVSMRMTHHVPSAQQVAADVESFLDANGFGPASIIAHSYGTLVASSMVKRRPASVAGLTLLDPVCFAMFLPHLLRNSIFFHVAKGSVTSKTVASAGAGTAVGKKSRGAASAGGAAGWSLRNPLKGVVVRDIHVAAALSRNSHWADVNLWPTDLPAHAPTTVIMSGSDHLVPVEEVQGMLTTGVAAERGVRVHVHAGKGHGAFVVDPAMQDAIIQGLGGLSEAAHIARQRGATVARRRSLDTLAQVASALQSLVQSVHDTMLGEQVSEAALRLLTPGLASRQRARMAVAAQGGARAWFGRHTRAGAKYTTLIETAAAVGCSGGEELLEVNGGVEIVAVLAGCSGGLSPRRLGSSDALGAMQTRTGGVVAGRRPGLMRLRPWVRPPLNRLSPALLRVCSGLLTPRRTCIQGAAGLRGGIGTVAARARRFVKGARALLRFSRTPTH